MADTNPEFGVAEILAWGRHVLKRIAERWIAVAGVALSVLVAVPDLRKHELSLWGTFSLFLAAFFFFIDVSESARANQEEITEKLKTSEEEITRKLGRVEESTRLNTSVLRNHEHILSTRTTDNLSLVAFKNLLAYLPFYLAEDLGYFQDEHIAISTKELLSLDDETTAAILRSNATSAIAICDPYMCVGHLDLKVIYPLCQGVAAWPMTLNWIGSAEAVQKHLQHVTVAGYKAPSTTHVLAQLVAKKVIRPLLTNAPGITPDIVELIDDEARFGEYEDWEDVSNLLRKLLMKYDVIMLWEPHCEMALSLGARYLHRNVYEKALDGFDYSPMYSAVIMTAAMIQENPTLPRRLRRALDRSVARLQDPHRLRYCDSTLNERSLLSGLSDEIREAVLSRLVESMPSPVGAGVQRTAGWSNATQVWADGIFAADKMRQLVAGRDPLLATKLGISPQRLPSAGEYRSFIYSQEDVGGR
jgi:hypothetical protein